MTTIGRVRGWQGRMAHSRYKQAEARQQDYVRVVRAFNLEAGNIGMSKDAIALGVHGIEQSIMAGLPYDAVRAIGWHLAKGEMDKAEEVLKNTVPEFDPVDIDENGELQQTDTPLTAAEIAANLAEKHPVTEVATEAQAIAKKPAKAVASKPPKADKKADKDAAKLPAKEPAKPVASKAPESDPTEDDQYGYEA
ncbi:hypothetical protein [Hyphomicrobium sp.]|uniref:hypothetical protein n=1 Tax=Hyphomicrobium sp. TaxID=82 RepID=UPI001D4E14A1|nr:hypothetical protein [Hyphomicrobium sp.]MBY0559862.1 hypothetical protein [Hyphomicrobium sp.]